jgi:hypothetical protein
VLERGTCRKISICENQETCDGIAAAVAGIVGGILTCCCCMCFCACICGGGGFLIMKSRQNKNQSYQTPPPQAGGVNPYADPNAGANGYPPQQGVVIAQPYGQPYGQPQVGVVMAQPYGQPQEGVVMAQPYQPGGQTYQPGQPA